MRPAELIEQKRNGGEHDPAELAELILAYARDEVPDYQLAALAMAIFFRGLTPEETYELANAMIATGDTVDLHSALGRKVVDKLGQEHLIGRIFDDRGGVILIDLLRTGGGGCRNLLLRRGADTQAQEQQWQNKASHH